jgi:serine/threonine protein kinase
MSLFPGHVPVPGYRLTHPLGQGAFGVVWEAARPDGSLFALKFLDCRQRSASQVAAEVRILRAVTALKHPNIIQLHEVHAFERYVILVLERADGSLEDLKGEYQKTKGCNIPDTEALDLLEQAAGALDFLATAQLAGTMSSRGLQHCDIKPSNLLLVGDTLKVADFGLCAGTGWQTHRKGWRGTPPYAAPELFNGTSSLGTDQYALAVTFCAVVMGERPFVPGALSATPSPGMPIDLTKLRTHEYPIIARALHPYPSSRWPSCVAFIQELRRVIKARTRPSAQAVVRPRKSGTFRVAGVPRQRPKNIK